MGRVLDIFEKIERASSPSHEEVLFNHGFDHKFGSTYAHKDGRSVTLGKGLQSQHDKQPITTWDAVVPHQNRVSSGSTAIGLDNFLKSTNNE